MSEHRFRDKARGVKTTIKITNTLFADRDRKGPKLTVEEANHILAHTDLSEKELKKEFRNFVRECPSGVMEKPKIISMLMTILPEENVKIIAEQIFTIYDKEKKGSINFTNFILATQNLAESSIESKLRLVFQLCDTDKSSRIQLKEIVRLFGTFYMNEGVDKHLAVERAYQVFQTLDTSHDGCITEEEFIKGCLQDRELVKALK